MFEEERNYYTERAFDELTKLLVSQLHPYDKLTDRLDYIADVRKRCTELLDQLAADQQEPPQEDNGKKGWLLYQREGISIVNPIIFKYYMLQKLSDKETFRLYRKSFHSTTWSRSWHPLLAWNKSNCGTSIAFELFSDDRLAPGDVVVLGNDRWVVTDITWMAITKTWFIHADKAKESSPETTFELDDPKDNTEPVPIYGAPVKIT